MSILTYMTIGLVFGFISNVALDKLPSKFKKPPQIQGEFGWVDNLILIIFWPLCICIIIQYYDVVCMYLNIYNKVYCKVYLR